MHVIFKPFSVPSKNGTMVLLELARKDHGQFLQSLLSAPKRTPISFEAAMALCHEKHEEMIEDGDYAEANHFLYKSCLASFLNLMGFHVELRGDEYSVSSQQIAA